MNFFLIAGFPDSIINFREPLIDKLLSNGFKVHVAAPGLTSHEAVNQKLLDKGVQTYDVPLCRTKKNPFSDIRTLLHLIYLMYVVRPDYVMCYTIKPVIYGMLAAKVARVPNRYALITGLGYAFQGDGARGMLKSLVQKLYALSLRNASKVFFQNPDDELLFRTLNILSKAVPSFVVNGSGVDTAEYKKTPLPKTLRLLLIARLLGDKGVREYVSAARIIAKQHPDVVFSLVGWLDDSPDSISQQELDDWVEEGIIDYQGRLDDVRPAISQAGVYVLPSYREGTPRTVLEAMAMGRAIITTDAPGCRETVVDGENGILVSVKSISGLVKAINRFIMDPGLVPRMGNRSRQVAEDKYDVHKVNSAMLREMGI